MDSTISGVEETLIKTPGVHNLDVDVMVEMPPEDNGTVKPTGVETSETPGVATDKKTTDAQDTEEDQPSTEPLAAKGEVLHTSAWRR